MAMWSPPIHYIVFPWLQEWDYPGEYFYYTSNQLLYLNYNGTGTPPSNDVVATNLKVSYILSIILSSMLSLIQHAVLMLLVLITYYIQLNSLVDIWGLTASNCHYNNSDLLSLTRNISISMISFDLKNHLLKVLFNLTSTQWNPIRNITLRGLQFTASQITYMVCLELMYLRYMTLDVDTWSVLGWCTWVT